MAHALQLGEEIKNSVYEVTALQTRRQIFLPASHGSRELSRTPLVTLQPTTGFWEVKDIALRQRRSEAGDAISRTVMDAILALAVFTSPSTPRWCRALSSQTAQRRSGPCT